jgi:uncharacterized membrane protein YkoI
MKRFLAMLVVVSIGPMALCWADDEEKVPLDKLPKPVMEAVKKRFPKAEIVSASREKEGDKYEYEVSIKEGGKNIDVTLTPEGTILSLEKEIAAADLPKAVTEALEAKYPKAAYKTIEAIIKVKDGNEKLESYEVQLVTADKKSIEVVLSPDGKITKAEQQEDKKK